MIHIDRNTIKTQLINSLNNINSDNLDNFVSKINSFRFENRIYPSPLFDKLIGDINMFRIRESYKDHFKISNKLGDYIINVGQTSQHDITDDIAYGIINNNEHSILLFEFINTI